MNNTSVDELAVNGMREFASSKFFLKFTIWKTVIIGLEILIALIGTIVSIAQTVISTNAGQISNSDYTISIGSFSGNMSFVTVLCLWLAYAFAKKRKRSDVPTTINYVFKLISFISLCIALGLIIPCLLIVGGATINRTSDQGTYLMTFLIILFISMAVLIVYFFFVALIDYKIAKKIRYAFTKRIKEVSEIAVKKVLLIINIVIYTSMTILIFISISYFLRDFLTSLGMNTEDINIIINISSSLKITLLPALGIGIADNIITFIFYSRFNNFLTDLRRRKYAPVIDETSSDSIDYPTI